MTITFVDVGLNNRVEFNKDLASNLKISIKGNNNTIIVKEKTVLKNLRIEVECNHSTILIGDSCKIMGQIRMSSGMNQSITIGDFTTFQGVYLLSMEKNSKIDIGSHCMFSRDIEVRTSDAHSVIELATGNRLNIPKNVYIGNHVWVAAKAFITKGASISHDCIVGANSFVSGVFEETNVIIAGTPAKIIKRGITWNRSRQSHFSENEMNAWK